MKVLRRNVLYIYTDGSSLSGPRTGGIGIRFVILDELENEIVDGDRFFGYREASSNQMELKACVEALKIYQIKYFGSGFGSIEIRSDSRYVVNNVGNAIGVWPKQKWFGFGGRPILNVELWKDLVKQVQKCGVRVNFVWVKGHANDHHNRAVDKQAKLSAKSPLNKPLTVVTIRRKQTKERTRLGSVNVSGQRVSIRIVTTEYLREQGLTKYRYEVISKKSVSVGKVDFAFSKHFMSAGHSYVVTFNKDQDNPRILNIIKEIERKEKPQEDKEGM